MKLNSLLADMVSAGKGMYDGLADQVFKSSKGAGGNFFGTNKK